MDKLIGRTFDGYKLIEFLGTDGMAGIFKGFENKLSRWAVLKVVPFEPAKRLGEENLPASFRLQVQAIAALRHCNISIIYGYGAAEGWAYTMMEYISCGSLKDRIDPYKPFTWDQALNVVIPVSQALAYAHDRNIIHGDLKPANILMPEEDWPLLVADFGLTAMLPPKAHDDEVGLVFPNFDEQQRRIMAYHAPEVIQEAEIDARTNIYALGTILYQLLSGKFPYEGETSFDFLLARLTEPPCPVQDANPGVPSVFVPILDKALALNPDDRYQTMAEFSQNLIDARKELRRSGEAHDHSAEREVGADVMGVYQPETANVVLKITRTGQEFSVGNQAELTVGRARKNESPTIDLTPHGGRQGGVSRRHGRLLRHDDQWFVEDLSSTNGTYVNGAKIPPHQITPVHLGDLLRFGEIELEFGLKG